MSDVFSSILSKPSNEAEAPKPMPAGSYLCTVYGLPKMDKSTKKQTPYVEFTLNVLSAEKDVDAEQLEEMGGVVGKTIRATYYLSEAAEYRLREFLDHCGIPDADKKGNPLSHQERIDQSPGCNVIAFMRHESSDDGEKVFARLSKTAAAE